MGLPGSNWQEGAIGLDYFQPLPPDSFLSQGPISSLPRKCAPFAPPNQS